MLELLDLVEIMALNTWQDDEDNDEDDEVEKEEVQKVEEKPGSAVSGEVKDEEENKAKIPEGTTIKKCLLPWALEY